MVIFLPLKESFTLFPEMDFFAIPSLILSHLELQRMQLPKLTPSILMEIVIISFALVARFYFYMHQSNHIRLDFLKSLSLSQFIQFNIASSDSFKIICLLLRWIISLRKMLLLLAKFSILISQSPICIPLMLLLVLMKLASTSATIMYHGMENRHPYQTTGVMLKGSGKKTFILILDWRCWRMHLQPCE